MYWEFTSTEGGTEFHNVDIFLNDPSGNGFAVLTQARASEWNAAQRLLETMRTTIVVY